MKKKLIEVAMPLGRVLDPKERKGLSPEGIRRIGGINDAASREKSIRHGHPSTLHLWWARRPLAAARAVIFAQMVDDPSGYVDELLSDTSRRERAKRELAIRQHAWLERKNRYEQAGAESDTTVPQPGPEPTLEECAADLERERLFEICLLYTSPSPRDRTRSRMPSSA